MQFERDVARRFRESADVMRAVAAGETSVHASGILDRIAEEYERTAAELEALDLVNPDPERDEESTARRTAANAAAA